MTATTTGIEFLDLYREMLAHQQQHGGLLLPPMRGEPAQPWWSCQECLREKLDRGVTSHEIRKRYSYAVPPKAH